MTRPNPIIVFAQVPPPEHGQSRMVAEMLRVLGQEKGGLEVHHVNARFSTTMEDIGVHSLRKLILTTRYIFECLWIRIHLFRPALYYIPGPVKWSAVVRDWILLASLRPWFPQLILHWHAIGHGEWAHGSTRLNLPGPRWLDRGARAISRALLHAPEVSIAVSRNSTRDARAIDSRSLVVIPNGIVDPWPDFETHIRPLRRRRVENLAQNPGEPLRLLFLSRGTIEKGLPDALNAIDAWLSGDSPPNRPVHLTVAGGADSTTQQILNQTLADLATAHGAKFHCEILEFVQGQAKRECYERADLYLAPSHWESFGLTVAEALAAGVTVVAAASDGVAGVLPDGYPYLCAVRDVAGFTRILAEAGESLSHPDHLDFIGTLRSHFLNHYTDTLFASGILEVFHQNANAEAAESLGRRGTRNVYTDQESGDEWVKAENGKAEKRKEEINGQRSAVSGLESGIGGRGSGDGWVKAEKLKTEKRKEEVRYHQPSPSDSSSLPPSTAPQALPLPLLTDHRSPITRISIYLADQNPKLGRSLGISRMTEVVMEEMQTRDEIQIHTLSSGSSIRAGNGAMNHILPWNTRTVATRVLTDHFHPVFQLHRRPDVWYFPKGYLPALHAICSPSVVTIHDTIVQYYADHYPDWRTHFEYRYWAHMLMHTLTNADHILTVSQSSKHQILDFMKRHDIPEQEITVTYEPCLYESIPQPEATEKGDYVLHLASREPHKRTAWLIDYWLKAEHENLPDLHVVGTLPEELKERVAANHRIVKLPFLDDAALQAQFMRARALVFPSEIEGFGLPAIEAYYLGTPVCFVKDTSVEEVLSVATTAGGFDLNEPASLTRALDEVLHLPAAEIRRIGLKLRESYAAAKVVDRMMAVFLKAAAYGRG